MTGSRLPRPIKYDVVGKYWLVPLVLLLLPTIFIEKAILFMAFAFVYWGVTSASKLPTPQRSLFLPTAVRSPKFHKLCLYLLVLWLLKLLQDWVPGLLIDVGALPIKWHGGHAVHHSAT